jgi:TRAP-type C4-dicarboxylate transport system substrate-binding protein
METKKIRWVIAHEPAYLFYRVAEDFKRLVNQYKDIVNVEIEVLTNTEYNEKYLPRESITRDNLWKALQDNTVQITQIQTTKLAANFNRQMHVLDMPYLFDDHDHAQAVLEGPIGQQLLNGFDKSSKLKGLAYTYSGGFRLMPFKGSVKSLAEVAGQAVRSGMSPMAQDTIRAFGFEPVKTEIDEVSSVVKSEQVIGAEHVAQRLFPDQCEQWIDTIIDTEHSLFLTSIVVNTDWWDSLDPMVQDVFMKCAFEAARNERDLSVQDGYQAVERLAQQGVQIIKLDQQDKQELKQKVNTVYDKYRDFFEPGLIENIKKH